METFAITQDYKIALRSPAKYIKTKGIDENSFHAWLPVEGNSMANDDHPYSIPEGSKILIKEVKLRSIFSFPLHRPVVIMGMINNKAFCLVKFISFGESDGLSCRVRCTSLNPAVNDFWIPIQYISRVFIVEQILRPRKRKPITIKID